MPKQQRRFVAGKTYQVQGASKLTRALKFEGSIWLGGIERLVFRPVKSLGKFKNGGA